MRIRLLILMAMAAGLLGLSTSSEQEVTEQDLRLACGMACGQTPAPAGNCTVPARACPTKPYVVPGTIPPTTGVTCVAGPASCGSCSNTNITCQGTPLPGSLTHCGLTLPACCNVNTCATKIVGLLTHGTCTCTGPAVPRGIRLLANVTPNSPLCTPAPPVTPGTPNP